MSNAAKEILLEYPFLEIINNIIMETKVPGISERIVFRITSFAVISLS